MIYEIHSCPKNTYMIFVPFQALGNGGNGKSVLFPEMEILSSKHRGRLQNDGVKSPTHLGMKACACDWPMPRQRRL